MENLILRLLSNLFYYFYLKSIGASVGKKNVGEKHF